MATTPISITMRANDWQDIAINLDYLAEHCDKIGYTTSAAECRHYATIIHKRIEESK